MDRIYLNVHAIAQERAQSVNKASSSMRISDPKINSYVYIAATHIGTRAFSRGPVSREYGARSCRGVNRAIRSA